MHSASLTEELTDRTQRITRVLEELLGWESRWNGTVTVEDYVLFSGAKRYDCSICIREDIATNASLCWRTLIHEVLHAFSPPYSRQEYSRLKGWEEGVIEKTQRLFRPEILTQLSVTVVEEELFAIEANHPYNQYITLLEQLRKELAWPEHDFYVLLIQTPLAERADKLERLGLDAFSASEYKSYRTKLLFAQAVLTRG